MKKAFFLFILNLFIISGCDVVGSYTFIIENSTQETITLKFVNKRQNEVDNKRLGYDKEEVILLPKEEKTVRIVDTPINSRAHDCLTDHGIAFFTYLVFETYVNGVKLDKQLWQAENWTYNKKSDWTAEYHMTITNEMIEK